MDRGLAWVAFHSGGFGLLGMSERAEHMGAQLSIRSQPEQGTEIVVVDRK